MTKVLLVNPSYRNSYGGSIGSMVNPIFPVLSLATLAGVARKNHEVEILDLSWTNYDVRVFEEKLRSFRPDLVGFTVLSPTMNQVRDMSLAAKRVSSRILCVGGGPHVSALPQESLRESHLDAVVVGEGERTFAELCEGRSLHTIKGLVYRNGDDEIFENVKRDFITDLDELPFPAWDLFDLSTYEKKTSRLFARKRPFVAAEFSRGCIYRCDFCASKLTMALGYRKKSPARCAEEVRLMKKLGIREFMLTDDIFTSDKKWAKQVCEELIRDKNTLSWSCTNGIRVESADDELFRLMKNAGCFRVAFGFESGNDQVLKDFGKGGKASLELGRKAVIASNRAGLETMGFFMMGLSSDTEASLKETAEFARTLPLYMLKFGVTVAYPGTKMFHDYRRENLIRSYDWDQYHIYSGFPLFAHRNLSYDVIQKNITQAYRKATFMNRGFLLQRLKRCLRSFDFLYEILFFVKFLFLSYTQKETPLTYGYRDQWRTHDFSRSHPHGDYDFKAYEFRKSEIDHADRINAAPES